MPSEGGACGKKTRVRWGRISPLDGAHFGRHRPMGRHARDRYSQHYSPRTASRPLAYGVSTLLSAQ